MMAANPFSSRRGKGGGRYEFFTRVPIRGGSPQAAIFARQEEDKGRKSGGKSRAESV